MRKQTKVLLIAFALAMSLATAPALFAQDNRDYSMMGRNSMMGDGGMMGMMGSMMGMMDHCSRMMQETPDGSRRSNDRPQKTPPAPAEND